MAYSVNNFQIGPNDSRSPVLNWMGPTATNQPVMTAPTMSGARTVQTQPVAWGGGPRTSTYYPQLPSAQSGYPGAPSNETYVPSTGQQFGNGYQSGYAPPGNFRLVDNPGLPSQARDAIDTTFPSVAANPGWGVQPRQRVASGPSWNDMFPGMSMDGMAPNLGRSRVAEALRSPGGLSFADKFSNAVATGAMRMGLQPDGSVTPQTPSLGQQPVMRAPVNRTGTTAAGYTYNNGVRTGEAPWTAGLTPAQQYAVANGQPVQTGRFILPDGTRSATGTGGGSLASAGSPSNTQGGYTPLPGWGF